jgi:adenylate kinase family enzyme
MDTRPRVICGFPGVGKTTLFKKLKAQGILISDSDSSQFNKDQFPQNYIEHIQACLNAGAWVLCSTHTVVREALAAAGIKYALAVPADKYLKDEYMERYRKRGSPEAFLKLMDAKFEEFVDDVWLNDKHGLHIPLDEGQYLDSIADDIIKSDQGMKFRVVKSPCNQKHQLRLGQPYYSVEHMNGFLAGLAWKDLIALREFPGSELATTSYLVHADNARIFQDMALALNLDLLIEPTMNPKTVKLTYKWRAEVLA